MFANYCTGREDVKGSIAVAERQAQAHLSLIANIGGRLKPPADFVYNNTESRLRDDDRYRSET